MPSNFSKNLIIFILIFALFFSLYFFLRNIIYDTDDITYTMNAESGIKNDYIFWSSQHPLWGPLDVLAYQASKKLGNTEGALVPLQFINSIFGALAVSMFFLSLYILTGNRIVSLLVAMIFGVSFYFWHWSGCIKHYSVATFFTVLILYFIVRLEKGGTLNALGAGLATGISALFHSANIIIFLPIGITILIMKKTIIRNISNFLTYIIGLILFFVTPHLFIMNYFLGIQFNNFFFWAPSYPWFGLQTRFQGFDFNFNLQRLPIFLDRFWNIMAGFYSYYGNNPLYYFIWKNYFPILLILTGFFFIISIFRLFKERYPLMIFFILWIVLQWIGLWFVDPFNFFIYIILLPILSIFAVSLTCFIEKFKKSRMVQYSSILLLLILLIPLFFTNLFAAIIPAHQYNPFMETINHYRNIIKRTDTVVSSGINPDSVYFKYFIRANIIDIVGLHQHYPTIKPDEILKRLKIQVNSALQESKIIYIHNDLLNEKTEVPPWAPSNMNMSSISQFFKKNYIIEPIPGDDIGKYLILKKKHDKKQP
ncbi:MAG: hypothetical protein M1536_07235 [Firmicutes bacterium]|nr:hypothetical protein [Bacillota bacterium]